MEYGFTQKLFGYFYHNSCMKQAAKQQLDIDKEAIKQEYVSIIKNAKDIGKSRLMSSYCMGAYFIALNRKTPLSPEACYELYKDGLSSNKLFHIAVGNANSYLDKKKMPDRLKWSADSHLHRYENDWVVDIIEELHRMILNLVMIIIPAASVICAGMKAVLNWLNFSAAWTMFSRI